MAGYHNHDKRYITGSLGKQGRPCIVALDQLSLVSGDWAYLRSITLRIYEGEAVAITGAPNSGKSLLLACLQGIIQPASGTIQILGTAMPPMTSTLRRQIGVMPQRLHQHQIITVAETLRRYAALYEMPLQKHHLETFCQLYRLEPGAPVIGLTPLQQRMLCLALAIVHDPALVLLDEPLKGLIGPDADVVHRQLRHMRSEGRTVLTTYTTPIADSFLSGYDMVVCLNDGRIAPQEIARG